MIRLLINLDTYHGLGVGGGVAGWVWAGLAQEVLFTKHNDEVRDRKRESKGDEAVVRDGAGGEASLPSTRSGLN